MVQVPEYDGKDVHEKEEARSKGKEVNEEQTGKKWQPGEAGSGSAEGVRLFLKECLEKKQAVFPHPVRAFDNSSHPALRVTVDYSGNYRGIDGWQGHQGTYTSGTYDCHN